MKKTGKPAPKKATKVKTAKKHVKTRKAATSKKPAAVVRAAAPQPQTGGFSKRDLEEIRMRLNEMRDALSKNVEDKRTMDILEPEVGDSIDQATQSLDALEFKDNFTGASWGPVGTPPTVVNGTNVVPVNTTGPSRYYRLHKQ